MKLTFGKFVLQPVLGQITASEAAEARDMWVDERVLDFGEASRRTSEVLFLIREGQSGELAGVCTVYPGPLGKTGRTYWHFRMFMRKKFRGVLGLPHFVLFTTRSYLEENPPAGSEDICGVLIVAENPAFRLSGFREHFAKQKPPWILFSTDSQGRDIFYRDFQGESGLQKP